ncbi:MAG: carbon-nitrogen hydrolase family protein [Planctomycetota bacterium]|nr:MAG: carbon-nitrogen hydrolase family protein [Planctomycetota bacterium]
MDKGILQIATCQFGVTADIEANAATIRNQMKQAAEKGVDIVHFSECALSGYASVDFESFADYNWDLLKDKTLEIINLAGKLKLWVVLGSSHRLTEPNKPHNSLYLISPEGNLVDRYDKRFGTAVDMDNYTPGDHFVHFDINGVKCSLLICFDLRFPELYRKLYKDGVKCIFQSFYNARQQGPSIHSEIMRQTMQANAANNAFWVSMPNSCGWFCPYPSCFIQPDGRITEQLSEHNEGLMINTVDLNQDFYDPTAPFRDMAVEGKLTNATKRPDDRRSINRGEL